MWKKILALSGINWYVVLAGFLLLGGAWAHGYHKASVNCEKTKTKEAEVKIVEVIKEVERRVPIVQIKEVESAKQKAEIKRLKGELDEAINKRPENPACDLTDDERRGVDELLKKTKSSK